MTPKTHYLKIDTKWLDRIVPGDKTCEIRLNDRDYQRGDYIFFENEGPVGVCIKYQITHVLYFPEGLKDGYVALSIKAFTPSPQDND